LQNLIASKLGVQKIAGITALDTREKKTYELVPEMEVSVLTFFVYLLGSRSLSLVKTGNWFTIIDIVVGIILQIFVETD